MRKSPRRIGWRVRRYGWGPRRGFGILGLIVGLIVVAVLAFIICSLVGLFMFLR